MEMFSFPNTLNFNFDETNNEVSDLFNELDKIIGNNDSSDSVNIAKVIVTDPGDEKTISLLTELESDDLLNNSFSCIQNQFDFFEKNFTEAETSNIIHSQSFEENQDSLQSAWSLSTPNDITEIDNNIDTKLLNVSFKSNEINKKSRNSKKSSPKDHSRRYREKEKRIQRKLEQEFKKKSELNDRLAKKINLLNNLIELFNFICSFKTNY